MKNLEKSSLFMLLFFSSSLLWYALDCSGISGKVLPCDSGDGTRKW
jgi:hypothetical protein